MAQKVLPNEKKRVVILNGILPKVFKLPSYAGLFCFSSESNTFVTVNNGQYKVKIGEKDCNCCRASRYTTDRLVDVKCYKQ